MKNDFRRTVSSMFILLLLSTFSVYAQEEMYQSGNLLSPDSLLNAARIIIDSANCRVLITVDENGKPHAREMSPYQIEKDWVIWFGTSPISRKVKQIQNNPDVVVYYYDSDGLSYVSIAGKASLVNDPDMKAKYWKESWNVFYPDRDKDYILIQVTPENIEVVSFKYNIFWGPNWAPQSFDFVSNKHK
jgi:general stress protein 26